ncbi:transcription repressor OFP13-like [Zingiber officinale]|uniref:transcription repressor OFP13-like n=1 Tax=Zingiber officinale TaxID=94328 RepID=UPI001C4B8FF2|nr:transcription repressor OFP13-like [Zingiber officinale]
MERIKSYFNSIGPICIQEAKTQSFRGNYLCSTSYSTASPPFSLTHPLGSPLPCEDDDDSTTLPSSSSLSSDRDRKLSNSDELFARPVTSERFFYSPCTSKSIVEEYSDELDSEVACCERIAVLSEDPYRDFLASMEEVVAAHELREWRGLQELLRCYLRLNERKNHKAIVLAFVDLLTRCASLDKTS